MQATCQSITGLYSPSIGYFVNERKTGNCKKSFRKIVYPLIFNLVVKNVVQVNCVTVTCNRIVGFDCLRSEICVALKLLCNFTNNVSLQVSLLKLVFVAWAHVLCLQTESCFCFACALLVMWQFREIKMCKRLGKTR